MDNNKLNKAFGVEHEFFDFLDKLDLGINGCALFQNQDGRYFMVVQTDGGPKYTVNDRFYYDFAKKWKETQPWKLLYTNNK
jgi:hypothetical protein